MFFDRVELLKIRSQSKKQVTFVQRTAASRWLLKPLHKCRHTPGRFQTVVGNGVSRHPLPPSIWGKCFFKASVRPFKYLFTIFKICSLPVHPTSTFITIDSDNEHIFSYQLVEWKNEVFRGSWYLITAKHSHTLPSQIRTPFMREALLLFSFSV